MNRILVDLHRNEIHVYCPWSEAGPKACKSVNGATWDPKRKCWKYPLLWQTCLDIREKIAKPLGMDIETTPKMDTWARAEKERQKSIPDVNSLEGVELHYLPKMNPRLYEAALSRPFQTVGIKFGAMNREVLMADDPGLGKTMQTLGMFEEAQITGPILVAAPKAAAQITWPNEIRRWTDDTTHVFGAHIPPSERGQFIEDIMERCNENPGERHWVIMNPHWLRADVKLDKWGKYIRDQNKAKIVTCNLPELFQWSWSGIVVDESHVMLAGSTGNAKKWSHQRRGLGALDVVDGGLRIAISGTPFRGKPENLFGTLQWLRPKMYTSYWKWVGRHFEVEEEEGGWGASKMIVGEVRDEDRFYDEAKTVMIRRVKSQVAQDLPPKMYGGEPLDRDDPNSTVGVWLPMEKEQEKQYQAMVRAAEAEVDGGIIQAVGILAEMTRLKQFANSCMKLTGQYDGMGEPKYAPAMPSNKVNWIQQFLDDRDLLGKSKGTSKVIIASQFTGFINLIRAHLKAMNTEHYVLTGETSDKERVRIANEFQENPDSAKIFLLNTKAGGVSLTLDQADDVIICDETFIPDDQLQVEDRAHRLSRIDHTVTIWYLRSRGTIEESIGATTTLRESNCRALMDGARGVDYAKLLLK